MGRYAVFIDDDMVIIQKNFLSMLIHHFESAIIDALVTFAGQVIVYGRNGMISMIPISRGWFSLGFLLGILYASLRQKPDIMCLD